MYYRETIINDFYDSLLITFNRFIQGLLITFNRFIQGLKVYKRITGINAFKEISSKGVKGYQRVLKAIKTVKS